MQGTVTDNYDPIVLHLLYVGIILLGIGSLLAVLVFQHNRWKEAKRIKDRAARAKAKGKSVSIIEREL